MKRATMWAAAVLAGISLAAWGAPDAPEERHASVTNTVITSRQLSFDYGRMIAVFEGDVVVTDPEVHMTCDRLTVIFDGTNDVKSVTAVGDVFMRQADKSAWADMAVYVARVGEIVLTGNARLQRDRDTVMGDSITFWLNEERIVSRPARMILYPQEGKPTAGAAFGVLPDTRRGAGGRP